MSNEPVTMRCMLVLFVTCCFIEIVSGNGLLLLYRPKDISNECAFSQRLRFDISYGMGMSDTISLVFRTLAEIDYECSIEIVTEAGVYIVVVIKYPNIIGVNCAANRDAITVMKKTECIRLCDQLETRDVLSPYYTMVMNGRVRFRFLSNSSINSDINANVYQVTATSARNRPPRGCITINETDCEVFGVEYCFTTGVVCDGINNCGVTDWFDERRTGCGLPVEKLGYAPVVAVVAAVLCALLAAGHILLRCLPPLANSFFIFNANEDNRLCIDPVYKSTGHRAVSIEKVKRKSLIPVSLTSSSSNSSDYEESDIITQHLQSLSILGNPSKSAEDSPIEEQTVVVTDECPRRKITIRTIAQNLQKKFRRSGKKTEPVHMKKSSTQDPIRVHE